MNNGEDYTCRSHLIHRLVRRSFRVFRETWTPESSAADFRYLAVLVDAEGFSIHTGASLECVDRVANNDIAREWCEYGYNLWSLNDEELEREKGLWREVNGNRNPVEMQIVFRNWSWAHLWHQEMMKDLTRYSSPDARVRAVTVAGTNSLISSDEVAKRLPGNILPVKARILIW